MFEAFVFYSLVARKNEVAYFWARKRAIIIEKIGDAAFKCLRFINDLDGTISLNI